MNKPTNIARYSIGLASASPRRRELLAMLDIPFRLIEPIEVDETYPATLAPEQVPEYLSRLKADAYRPVMSADDLFVTADTVVILDGNVLGKPSSPENAVEMLTALTGRRHHVVTGVSAFTLEHLESFSATTAVEFADIPREEIEEYVSAFRPMDKAGAYGIQEWIGAVGIRNIEGSFYNVMGLPVHRLWELFKHFGKTALSV